MKDGTVERGWLGVQIQPVDKDIADSLGLTGTKGALVSEAQDDSPGKKAGIKAGDVITAVDGKDCRRRRGACPRSSATSRPARRSRSRCGATASPRTSSSTLGELPATDKQASADDQPAARRASGSLEQLRPDRHPLPRTARAWSSPTSIPTAMQPTAASRPATSSSRSTRRKSPAPTMSTKAMAEAAKAGRKAVLVQVDARRRQPLRRPAGRQGLIQPDSDASGPSPPSREHRIATEPARLSVSVSVPAAAGPIACCRNFLPDMSGDAMLSISAHAAESAYKAPMKILVIEDDREAADYLQKAFAEAGHTAHVAADGESGFALADSGDYDVLVVDRMLPRRDGLSRDRRLALARQHHAGAHPFRARRGRRPRHRPARRRRRLSDQALCLFRAARPRRGAQPPRRRQGGRDRLPGRRSRARPAVARGQAGRQARSSCSRANSGCSNI